MENIYNKLFGKKDNVKPLELPKTLRTPKANEVPMNSSVLERLKKRETANIVEGYTLKLKEENPEHKDLAFEFYAEINIDNSKLWDLFLNLTELLPQEVALLFGHIDAEIIYGNYSDKKQVLSFIKKYEKELVADTFMNFGLIFQTDQTLTEIFIDESKYVKFWGVDKSKFESILQKKGLKRIENLEFVDEYPKVREPLRLFDTTITDTNELIEILKGEYE
jgi:hypothetical protein